MWLTSVPGICISRVLILRLTTQPAGFGVVALLAKLGCTNKSTTGAVRDISVIRGC